MSNKGYPGKESFTISLTDHWYFSGIYHKISKKTSQACSLVTEGDQPGICCDI